LSADEPGLVVARVPVDAVDVDEVVVDEHPAIRRAAPTTKRATRRCPRRRRNRDWPMNVRTSFLLS
jgi:hypothetical protein